MRAVVFFCVFAGHVHAHTHTQVLKDGKQSEQKEGHSKKVREATVKLTGQLKQPFAKCLPYFDLVRMVHACIMHHVENLGKLLAKAQRGIKQASLGKGKLALEHRRGRWLDLRVKGGPKAPWALSIEEKVNIRGDLDQLQVPRTHGGFMRDYLKDYSHLRAHDWKVLMGEVMIYLMRHVEDERYAKLWCDLCRMFQIVHSYRVTESELQGLRRDIVLWRVEASILLPSSFATYVVHYLSHIPDTIAECGPSFTSWMYGNETLNGILTSFSHASRDVEVGMVRKWVLFKCAFFHRVHVSNNVNDAPNASAPSTWTYNHTVQHECSRDELAGFSSVLLTPATYKYALTTKKLFTGIKSYRSLPGTDLESHAHMWQSGKVTVQFSAASFPLLGGVHECLYGTVHNIFFYSLLDQRHILFKVCVWPVTLPRVSDRVQLLGLKKPAFTQFVYVPASAVSSIVCLFLPLSYASRAGSSHYVVHVNAL
jgi:hypothetical protein